MYNQWGSFVYVRKAVPHVDEAAPLGGQSLRTCAECPPVQVKPGSEAEALGVQPYDLLAELNGVGACSPSCPGDLHEHAALAAVGG